MDPERQFGHFGWKILSRFPKDLGAKCRKETFDRLGPRSTHGLGERALHQDALCGDEEAVREKHLRAAAQGGEVDWPQARSCPVSGAQQGTHTQGREKRHGGKNCGKN